MGAVSASPSLPGERVLAYVARGRAKVLSRAASGQCVHGLCPQPVVRARRCQAHWESLRGTQKAAYERHKAQGVCVRCGGEKAADGHVSCAECLGLMAFKNRERNKEKGSKWPRSSPGTSRAR